LTNVDAKIAVRFFVADMVFRFGRYGLFMWPLWLWPIWYSYNGRPLASRYGPSNGGIINHLERPLT